MGLIKTIKDFFRAKSLKAENALINPVDQSELAISDSEKQIDRFKTAIAHAMSQNNILVKQKDQAEGDVQKYTRIAGLAVKGGSDDDARQALTKKNDAQTLFNNLATQIDQNNVLIASQRKQLDRAGAVIIAAKNNQAILAARLEGAHARKDLAKAGDNLGEGGALSKLGNLQKAVDSEEGEANAFEELNHTNDVPLEEKYDASKFSVEDELARLKSKQ